MTMRDRSAREAAEAKGKKPANPLAALVRSRREFNQPEDKITLACSDLLKLLKIPHAITNPSKQNFGPGGRLRRNRRGLIRKGWPDITACVTLVWKTKEMTVTRRGVFTGIENKIPVGGRQSKEQKEAEAEIKAAGGIYWLIHSAEELKKKLEGR